MNLVFINGQWWLGGGNSKICWFSPWNLGKMNPIWRAYSWKWVGWNQQLVLETFLCFWVHQPGPKVLQQGAWPGIVQKQFTSSENQHSCGTWCLNDYLFPIGMVAVQGAMVIFQTFAGVIAYGVTLNYRFHLPTEDGCCLSLLSLMNIIRELHCYSKTSRPSRVAWDYLHFLTGWCLVMSKWDGSYPHWHFDGIGS